MTFALIVCTFQRPDPLLKLLKSVQLQDIYPNQIIIIDGSKNNATEEVLNNNLFENLTYFKVKEQDRGLTKQRNFGIEKVHESIEVVCFLDDDIVLEPNYFKNLLSTYSIYPEAIGVGGYICNEVNWKPLEENTKITSKHFVYDGWYRKDGARFVLRKKFGLDADRAPAHLPNFSHGRSVSFLPPSGKIYEAEQFMGGVASYKKTCLDTQKFSEYFEGYGLYEDADYTFRLSKKGKLYVNTAAVLNHYHDGSGRPNMFKYGKMVIRNGWYVWRVRHENPSLKARFKWNATAYLLTLIRFTNILTSSKKKEAFMEGLGRTIGWLSLQLNKPKLQ